MIFRAISDSHAAHARPDRKGVTTSLALSDQSGRHGNFRMPDNHDVYHLQ